MNDNWSRHFILKLGSKIPLKYVVTDTHFLSLEDLVFIYLNVCACMNV